MNDLSTSENLILAVKYLKSAKQAHEVKYFDHGAQYIEWALEHISAAKTQIQQTTKNA
jgi:hypothetical protein